MTNYRTTSAFALISSSLPVWHSRHSEWIKDQFLYEEWLLELQLLLLNLSVAGTDDIDYFAFQGDEFCLTKEQEKWVVNIMLSVTLVKLLLGQ